MACLFKRDLLQMDSHSIASLRAGENFCFGQQAAIISPGREFSAQLQRETEDCRTALPLSLSF